MSREPAGDRATRYLLGELPDAERDALESDYFADDEAFAELQAAEDDLYDAYGRGLLAPDRRARFEERYLRSDADRERVAFARALKTATAEGRLPLRRRAAAPWATWAAGLAATVAVVLFVYAGRVRSELARLAADRDAQRSVAAEQEKRSGELADQIAALRRQLAQAQDEIADLEPARLVSILLQPGSVRSVEPRARVRLASATTRVRLVLRLVSEGFPEYRVSVEDVDGAAVWTGVGQALPVEGQPALRVTLPASLLTRDQYMVVVTGVREGRSVPQPEYVFGVARRE